MKSTQSRKAQFLPAYQEMIVAYVTLFGFASGEEAKPIREIDTDDFSSALQVDPIDGYRTGERLKLLDM